MIPRPQVDTPLSGQFPIPETIRLSYSAATHGEDKLYQEYLISYTAGLMHEHGITAAPGELWVELLLESCPTEHPESYYLDIMPGVISIKAPQIQGLRHGFQCLLQLLYLAITGHGGRIQGRHIEDRPRYTWRGLHLDVSRHFFDEQFVRQYLEWMEALKLNRFHWHLCDDQGWRVESRKFPLLHEKGAWRVEADGSRYGGYYSRDAIHRLVEYAASMGIEVIPEIDIPGHAQAILAAYPHLACFPQEFACLNVWGISDNILCAGKDDVLTFLKELLTEIAELFPSDYIHLGGDEVPKDKWRICPHCQQRIKDNGLHDEEELQSWLLAQMVQHLRGLGKTVIGWDEILDGNIDSQPVVMVWRGDGRDAAAKAENNGNRYVLCPNNTLYFDWKQSPDSHGAHGVSTLENVYAFDPISRAGKITNLLLGAQANLWTEYMPDAQTVRSMLFPRVFALAEILWTYRERCDYTDFIIRLNALEGYL